MPKVGPVLACDCALRSRACEGHCAPGLAMGASPRDGARARVCCASCSVRAESAARSEGSVQPRESASACALAREIKPRSVSRLPWTTRKPARAVRSRSSRVGVHERHGTLHATGKPEARSAGPGTQAVWRTYLLGPERDRRQGQSSRAVRRGEPKFCEGEACERSRAMLHLGAIDLCEARSALQTHALRPSASGARPRR